MTTYFRKPLPKETAPKEIELHDFKKARSQKKAKQLLTKEMGDDQFINILEHSDPQTAARLAQVNHDFKRAYATMTEPDEYWKKLTFRDLTEHAKLERRGAYRAYYQHHYRLVNLTKATLQDEKATHAALVKLFIDVVIKNGLEKLIPKFADKINYTELCDDADKPYNTLLHLAVWYDQPHIVAFLLASHVPVNPVDGRPSLARFHPLMGNVELETERRLGVTPLFYAAKLGRDACLRELIRGGGEVNFQDSESGDTALHAAAAGGHLGCFQLLIANGAGTNVANKDNKTALDYARNNHSAEWQKYMQETFPVNVVPAAH